MSERIGIYGGTFSPIHSGHVRAARSFLDSLGLDRLYVIPTAEPPHKAAVEGASAEDRLEMARLALEGIDSRIVVSDFEQRREGKSYTVYTLEGFSAPGRELFLLVGTDMFVTLDSWYRAGDIFALADIVLMRRESDGSGDGLIAEKRREYEQRFGARIHELGDAPLVVSSTELRELIRAGGSVDGLIPPRVVDYIRSHRLYPELVRSDLPKGSDLT